MIKVLYTILDITGLWWRGSFEYYQEKSLKINCYFLCRRSIYTGKQYFKNVSPVVGWNTDSEWIEYKGKIDNILN